MLALRIKKAVRQGATLVVADPRKIWLTKLAKRHLQLRPGSDVWLLNAMMHTILEEGLSERGVHPRVHRRLRGRARGRRALLARGRRDDDRRPRRGHSRHRTRVRERAARGDLLHARDHRARVRGRQHLVAREPRAHDRPSRLRVHRPQRAARPEQRPGAERLGSESLVPAGLPGSRRSGNRAQVLERMGNRDPVAPRLPPRPDRSRASTTDASRRSTSSARTRRRPSRTRATSKRASKVSISSCPRTSS